MFTYNNYSTLLQVAALQDEIKDKLRHLQVLMESQEMLEELNELEARDTKEHLDYTATVDTDFNKFVRETAENYN